ncbi:hypothetical protein EYF80_030195 [Liparis tanakae]|uniref:Uncharacterized protein n=1 Tax=Liparis tanakae TaxID=230148 RepID=A0A4Z2H3F5_9TELE|nr:hypothetical protein EYF80_030195 [Liparis tanakae]
MIKRRERKKTPGAVQTSQLIPQQAIGCERLSVTVGPSKAEHHLLRACCDENKGRRGRRGMGAKGGRRSVKQKAGRVLIQSCTGARMIEGQTRAKPSPM